MKKTSVFFAMIAVLLVSACTFQTKHRGYVFPKDLDDQLTAVKTTSDLTGKFGSPQAKTIFGDPVWIYYGADENYHGPFPITYANRKVLLVWTDPAGTRVLQTKVLNDADMPRVRIDKDTTPIPAEIRLNAIQELISNIGRFSPTGMGQ
ncbi:MAG: hypothetical protein FWC51_04665 [Proteobacteria bacterium]|nr:hypothetical protein [Pseudomonadota bacterium]